MVARVRNDFPAVLINGRTYRLGAPPSEQDDVLALTRRLVNKTPAEAAQVVITEAELRRFGLVYIRLRQVPWKNRARLEAWRDAHPQEVQAWQLAGFFNRPEDEAPGYPLVLLLWPLVQQQLLLWLLLLPQLLLLLRPFLRPLGSFIPFLSPLSPLSPSPRLLLTTTTTTTSNLLSLPLFQLSPPFLASLPFLPFPLLATNRSPESSREPSPDNAMIADANPNPQPAAPPAAENPQDPIPPLRASLGSIRTEVLRLERLSNRAHSDDPYRAALSSMAHRVSDALEQADRSVTALVRKRRRHHNHHHPSSSDKDEPARRNRLHARRAQILAGIDNESGNDAANAITVDSSSDNDPAPPPAPARARERAENPQAGGARLRPRRRDDDTAQPDHDLELPAPEPPRAGPAAARRRNLPRRDEPVVKVEKKEEAEEGGEEEENKSQILRNLDEVNEDSGEV
ncbi:hypothetical protein C8A05DRAFT_38969 [Staphylotrichum tortipilum]|uniref:Uncharacterized protein n=1 Tax=Staphylotrichum tortipilum TaxID=2831512 RepID=A0AAN6MC80_9PEZI|nr:hypothetical protein C8A05DRAFT_38969 [Staphylotrichum longicolle]